jgi:hypothetical protein
MIKDNLILRSLKGSPLSIVLCLILFPSSNCNIDFIIRATGYSKPTIRAGIDFLQSLELIDYNNINNYYYLINSDFNISQLTTPLNPGAVLKCGPDLDLISYLQSVGVSKPMALNISKLPWASLDYCRAHFKFGLIHSDSVGLIIHRIKCNDPKPKNSPFQYTVDDYQRSWNSDSNS